MDTKKYFHREKLSFAEIVHVLSISLLLVQQGLGSLFRNKEIFH